MAHIAVLGAGITGVTTAYALVRRGYHVTVFEQHRYAAMETSYANGGQLSASNSAVWNSTATVLNGLRWMLQRDAPLLINPAPSWHKYAWLAEFIRNIPHYRQNTIDTVRMAIRAKRLLLETAERENISFDLERRGILHVHHDHAGFDSGLRVNALLNEGGLERFPVTPLEIASIEPALRGSFHGGFFTPSDATGDIHKFTRGLATACVRRGVRFLYEAHVDDIVSLPHGFDVRWRPAAAAGDDGSRDCGSSLEVDGLVVCAGTASHHFARILDDRLNVYPVKGYSITIDLDSDDARQAAPYVSLLDESVKIVTSRLGTDRFRVAGTAEFNGFNRDIRSDRILPLINWTRAHFPGVPTSAVVPWAGLRPMTPDMMPVVRAGKQPGIFYNTGHGHLGWTLSAATAEMLGDIVDMTTLRPESARRLSA